MIRSIYGLTETNEKIKIGEYDDGIVIHPVGGRIFYIDSNSDEVVTFYDAQGNVLSNVDVGDTPYGYVVTSQGISGKDKFYVYNPSIGSSKNWGYTNIRTNADGETIGSGKTNTSTVLLIEDTSGYAENSIWTWLNVQNNNTLGDCNDWFIGSKDELEELRLYLNANADGSVIVNFFDGGLVLSSSEYDKTRYNMWQGASLFIWSVADKIYNHEVCAIRSF